MPEPRATTVMPALIVEDAAAMQQQLRALLLELPATEATGVTIAASLAAAHAFLAAHPVALALVDIGLPDGSGIDLIAWLHLHRPCTTVVVVSSWGDENTVLAALRAGATGYLLKDRDAGQLRRALRTVQRGGAPIDPFVARGILDQLVRPAPQRDRLERAPRSPLTAREEDTLRLVEYGYSNREIADLRGLSPFTIEGYVKAIYRKLAVRSRTAAVFAARARGLLP